MNAPFQGLSITEGNTRPNNTIDAIQSFFSSFTIEEVHRYMSQLAACALTESEEFFHVRAERNNVLFFCEQTWYLIQGIYHCQDILQKLNSDAPTIIAQ